MGERVVLQHQQLQRRHIHEPVGGNPLQLVPLHSQFDQLGQTHELHGPDLVEAIPGQAQPAQFKAPADGGGRDCVEAVCGQVEQFQGVALVQQGIAGKNGGNFLINFIFAKFKNILM